MIKEERIIKASNRYSTYKRWTSGGDYHDDIECEKGFREGAQWAIEELKPMFIEFLYFSQKKMKGQNDDRFLRMSKKQEFVPLFKNMEELFELFLKEKEYGAHN